MQAIYVPAHRDQLEALLSAHASEPIDLMLVESIAAWCSERGTANPPDPIAMAVRCGETERAGVLIRSMIRGDRMHSAIDRMLLGDHDDLPEQLRGNPALFLSHLVLHELAHLTNNWGQEREDDCDRWAFARLFRKAD